MWQVLFTGKLSDASHSSFHSESTKVAEFQLPLLFEQSIEPRIDLTDVYDRCLARRYRSTTAIEVTSRRKVVWDFHSLNMTPVHICV